MPSSVAPAKVVGFSGDADRLESSFGIQPRGMYELNVFHGSTFGWEKNFTLDALVEYCIRVMMGKSPTIRQGIGPLMTSLESRTIYSYRCLCWVHSVQDPRRAEQQERLLITTRAGAAGQKRDSFQAFLSCKR